MLAANVATRHLHQGPFRSDNAPGSIFEHRFEHATCVAVVTTSGVASRNGRRWKRRMGPAGRKARCRWPAGMAATDHAFCSHKLPPTPKAGASEQSGISSCIAVE